MSVADELPIHNTRFHHHVHVTVYSQYHLPLDLDMVDRTECQVPLAEVAIRFPPDSVMFAHLSEGFQVA